jgi:hypothetical protein
MQRYLPVLTSILLTLGCSVTPAAEARLDTTDFTAYQNSLGELSVGLTQQEIADLNWQLTLRAYGDKPATVTDEDYVLGMMTFMMEHTDIWLKRLAVYDGWTANQIMAPKPGVPAGPDD